MKIFEKNEAKPKQIKNESKESDEKQVEKPQNNNRKCPFYKFITSIIILLIFKLLLKGNLTDYLRLNNYC